MDFRTIIPIEKSPNQIDHSQLILLLGSCFAENIGERLATFRFRADINPFGTLYNPLSIAAALNRLVEGRPYSNDELFESNGIWHSRDHHTRFSHTRPEICLEQINNRFLQASLHLPQAQRLMVTFGSAYVYFDKTDKKVVANCHKRPESGFNRRLVSPEEIVRLWDSTLRSLLKQNPGLRVLFTVSPIRHIRDGLHANQVSKATLLLAIDQLCRQFPQAEYFPAYEIMNDELRDYRFYSPDMIHPSETAVEYIWERFSETYFSLITAELCQEWEKINKALNHRPMVPDSIAYKNFIMQNLLKMKNISEKYPFFDIQNEIYLAENLLSKK